MKNKFLQRMLMLLISIVMIIPQVWGYGSADGTVVYFNKQARTELFTGSVWLRRGNESYNEAKEMSLVAGTKYLYSYTMGSFEYKAISIANGYGWTGGNTIYQPKSGQPGDAGYTGGAVITQQTEYYEENISGNFYIKLTTGEGGYDYGCRYYQYEHGDLPKFSVSFSKTGNGTLTVTKCTGDENTDEDYETFTSGDEDFFPTQIIKIVTTPDRGYRTTLNVTGATSLGSGKYYVTGNCTITATFDSQWVIRGSMSNDSWETRYSLGNATGNMRSGTINLAVGNYEFKVYNRDSEGSPYGCAATISTTTKEYNFYTNVANACGLTITQAGTYHFNWDEDNHQLTVIYPDLADKKILAKNTILYFDARNANSSGWQNKDFIARFWFKYYDSGLDYGSADCAKSNPLGVTWMYYATVPDHDYIGRVQMNRINPSNTSEVWCSAYIDYAYERTNGDENCLAISSDDASKCGSFRPQWTYYRPPMSSATLTNDGTQTVTYGGDGGSSTPYLVATGSSIYVNATSTSAVTDNQMTPYYQFKKEGTNDGGESSTSTHTYTASATSGTKEAMTVVARNKYHNGYGTASPASTAVYYEARTPYSVTHTLYGVTATSGGTGEDAVVEGSTYNAQFSASDGYHLPSSITVKFGSSTKTAGTDYTWNSSTGNLAILADKIDDDVEIIIYGTGRITYSNTGADAGSAPSDGTTYKYGDEVKVKDNTTLMTKSGQVFAGWTDGVNIYVPGKTTGDSIETFTFRGDVSLSPVWKRGSYLFNLVGSSKNGTLNTDSFSVVSNVENTARTINGVCFSKSSNKFGGTSAIKNTKASANRYMVYDTRTTKTMVRVYAMNVTSSSKKLIYNVIKEGVSISEDTEVTLGASEGKVIVIYANSENGARVVLSTNDNSNMRVAQIIVAETGTELPKIGETGFELAFPGRISQNMPLKGTTISSADDLTFGTSSTFTSKSNSAYMSFDVAAATQLQLTTSNNKGFYVCTDKSSPSTTGSAYSGTSGLYKINLKTASTYYIFGSDGSNKVNISKIAFADKPVITYSAGTGGSGTKSSTYFTVADNGVGDFSHATLNFIGWNTKANGSGTPYAVGDDVTDNITLHAQWGYTVTYNLHGHGSDIDNDGYPSGSKITKPTDPYEAGYEFDGWYKESTYENKWNFASDVLSANTTLHAKWMKVYATTMDFAESETRGTDPNDQTLCTKSVDDKYCDYDAFRVDNYFFSATKLQYETGNVSEPKYNGWKCQYSGATIKFFVENDCSVAVALGANAGCNMTYTPIDDDEEDTESLSTTANTTTTRDVEGGTMVTLTTTSGSTVTLKSITITDKASCSAPAEPTVSGTTSYIVGETIELTADITGSNHDSNTEYTWYKGADWTTASAADPVQAAAKAASNGHIFTKTAAVGDAGTYWCLASNDDDCEAHNETGKAITVVYQVTYDKNGGTGDAMAASTGTSITLSSNGYTAPSGYTFDGWRTVADKNASGTDYAAGTSSITQNLSLYAMWKQTVKLDANGGSDDGSLTAYYNASGSFSPTAPTYTDHTVYDYRAEDGTEVLTSAGAFKATSVTDDSDDNYITSSKWVHSGSTTLYARWKCDKPTVTCTNNVVTMTGVGTIYYTTDGSTTPTSSSDAYDPSNKPVITANTTIKAICIEAGCENSNVTTEACTYTCIDVDAVEDLECSAQTGTTLTYTWTKAANASGYKATLYSNSGCTSEVTHTDIDNGNTETVTFTSLSANTTYYCQVQSKGDGTTYCEDGGTTSAASGTTLAQYDVTIAVNPSGYGTLSASSVDDQDAGTLISISDDELTIGETTITATPTSDGVYYTYTFSSWKKSDDSALPASLSGNLSVNANFTRTAVNYTLTWDVNGGDDLTGEYTHGTVAYGASITKPSDPTRDGYDFAGWDVTPAATMPAENTTYTAQWATKYTVTFNPMTGGSVTPTSAQGSSVTKVTLPTPTHATYTFDGWYNTAGEKVGDAGDKINPAANITLYAKWTGSCAGGGSTTITLTHFEGANHTPNSGKPDGQNKYLYGYKSSTLTAANALTITTDGSTDVKGVNSNVELELPYNKKIRIYADTVTTSALATGFTGVTAVSFKWKFKASGSSGTSSRTVKYTVKVGSTTVADAVSVTGKTNDGYATVNLTSLSNLSGYVEIGMSNGSSTNDNWYLDDIAITYNSSCYTVTYHGNNADGGYVNDPVQHTAGTSVSAQYNSALNGYERSGYDFVEWNTAADGSGDAYKPFAQITSSIAQNYNLYAQWRIVIDADNTNITGKDSPTQYRDVRVTNGATLTITNDEIKVRDITVETGSTLNVNTTNGDGTGSGITFTARSLSLVGGWGRVNGKTEYDMPRVYIDPLSTLTKTNPTVNFDIAVDNRSYYPFALPFNVTMDVAHNVVDYANATLAYYSNYYVDEDYRGQYAIKTYNGQRRANVGGSSDNWEIVTDGTTLTAGRGYALTALPAPGYGDYAVIRFPMNVDDAWTAGGENGSITVEVEEEEVTTTKNVIPVTAYKKAEGETPKVNTGWNLLGVPFMSCYRTGEDMYSGGTATIINGKFDYKTSKWVEEDVMYVTVPNHDFSEYIQADLTDDKTVLLPGWCFFVQIATSGNLTFLDAKQAASTTLPYEAPRREQAMPTLRTGIILSGAEASDKTTILVSDKYSAAEYEINADLEKMFGENSFTLATYSLFGSTRFAYNAMSNADAANIIPIGYRAPADGEYTFSINPRYAENGAFEHVNLIDYETGIMTDLLMGSYTFSTERTQLDTRFALNVVPRQNTPTDIENAAGGINNANGPRKVLINDKMYIIVDGKMYDATGKAVK